jgi:hypothetical protein
MLFLLILSSALLIYVLLRAQNLSFTHDESLSYTIVEGNTAWLNTANNHNLNTILMLVSKKIFGSSEFALRLPNVLAFFLYLIACYLIFKSSRNNWFFLLGIAFLLLNPFLLEFFSLARGYGLSLAFMLMSMFFIIKNGFKNLTYSSFLKDFILAVLFASLAVYSNLAMLNFLISVIILFAIKFLKFRNVNFNNLKYNIAILCVFFVSCIPLYIGIARILLLKNIGQLYFGASTFMETVDSLILSSIYFEEYGIWTLPTIKLIIVLFLAIGILSVIIKKEFSGALFLIISQIFILTIGLFLENFLFDAKYPLERTSLFYLPVISLFIYHFFIHLSKNYKIKKIIYALFVFFLLIPLFVNFLIGANLTHTKSWKYDAHTKDMMKIIRDKIQLTGDSKSISNHWLFEPSINYYINAWKLNLNPANRNGVDLNSDFIYRLDDNTKKNNYITVEEYNDINSSLLMKKLLTK